MLELLKLEPMNPELSKLELKKSKLESTKWKLTAKNSALPPVVAPRQKIPSYFRRRSLRKSLVPPNLRLFPPACFCRISGQTAR